MSPKAPTSASPQIRIGYGWDSHEFKSGVPLKIGGIDIDHPKGLGGHSDGDVLLHAVTDALLGAVAAPDIGTLFSPSDAQWKGADSAVFLREALKQIASRGYRVTLSFVVTPVEFLISRRKQTPISILPKATSQPATVSGRWI